MKFNKKQLKRLGVFIFYDKEGIIDDYVLYMLDSLKEATNDIIIFSNSYLGPEEMRKFNNYSNKIHVRKNIGLDAGAFKDAFDIYGDYFKKFDELLLLNDTFFGPFDSFKNICKNMESKDVDFWGLSANYNSVDGYGFLPDKMIHSHIQTFFVAYRHNVLNSDAFNNYWKNYDISKMHTFIDVVTKHELSFTYFLEQNGFKWDVYANLKKYNNKDINKNFNCYAYASYDMIKNLKAPFLKRKNFVFEKKDLLFLSDGNDVRKSLDYLEKNNIYDTNLIWDNLVRIYNPRDLYYGLNLNYILTDNDINMKSSFALVIILDKEEYLPMYVNFIKELNINNTFVFTENEKIEKKLLSKNINVIKKSDFDPENYDYIGIINDDNYNNNLIPTIYENSFLNIIKNGFNSSMYINNVMNVFENNKYLGLLLLPSNLHGEYFKTISDDSTIVPANYNACIIKSSLFDWNEILTNNFVQNYIGIIDKKKFVFGKIYNINEVGSILSNNDYIIQNTYKEIRNRRGISVNSYTESINNIIYFNSINDNKFIRKLKNCVKKIIRR